MNDEKSIGAGFPCPVFLTALERKHLPYMTIFDCVNRIIKKFFKFIFYRLYPLFVTI